MPIYNVTIPLATPTTDGLMAAKDKAALNAITSRKTMKGGGIAPDVDVVIMLNTTSVAVSASVNLAVLAQTFMLRGSAPVTVQAGVGQTIDGGAFTKSPGTPTSPASVTLVRNPDLTTQLLRLNS